jgi:hypothetical protein
MHVDAQPCPDCGTLFDLPDNYCRHCGMYLAALKATLPAPVPERAVVTSRPGMPAPMRKAATALAIGTALQVGVTLAGKYLASQAARGASEAVQSAPPPARRRVERRQPDPEIERAAAVSETVIIRRQWIRRD